MFFFGDDILKDKDALKVTYSLKEETKNIRNNKLNFKVMKYHYNGTLLSFDDLEDDFLQCSNSFEEKTNYKYFGNNVKNDCGMSYEG